MNSLMGPLTVATTEKGLASVHFGKSVPSGVAADESGNRTRRSGLLDDICMAPPSRIAILFPGL